MAPKFVCNHGGLLQSQSHILFRMIGDKFWKWIYKSTTYKELLGTVVAENNNLCQT